jgi:GntR family transcriptional regulator
MVIDISFQVDQKSGIPIYVQLMDQIKHLIATGLLRPGDQLPTIRELAVHLTINLHTVAHAYAELEREGFLSIQRGRGTFITNGYHEQSLGELREQRLQNLIDSMFAEALNLGYEPEEVQEVLATQIGRWRRMTQQIGESEGN